MRHAPWKILLATLIPLLCALPATAQGARQADPADPAEPAASRSPADPSEPAEAAEPAPPLELVVNIPAGRLEVLRDGAVGETYPVSVGGPKHPTPMGRYEISKAVWNPRWHPPESFWARNEKPAAPGPNNPMGRVKLYYEPLFFIHGTPETEKLGRPASHGCIRMANLDVVPLALLLHQHATPGLGREEIERISAAGKTREIPFEEPVPLSIEYELVEVSDGRVVVHPDVYRRGGGREQLAERIVEALAAHGVAAESVDREQVAALADEAREQGGSRPVEELVSTSPQAVAATLGR